MAMSTGEKIAILAGIGLVGYFGWQWYQKNQAGGAAPSVGPLNASQALNAGGPVNVPGLAPANMPAGNGPVSLASTPDGVTVSNWMNTLDTANRTQALAELQYMTADELSQMANIINNVWAKGLSADSEETDFWNAWRVKYHVLDGTYT
jgi:predicted negative regulator of RcsB-dependent stress response